MKKIFIITLLVTTVIKIYGQNYSITTNLPIAEIAGTGTSVTMTNSASSAALPIGFSFNFWGTAYTDFYINPSGAIQFGSGSTTTFIPFGGNSNFFPSANPPNNFVAFAWIAGSSNFANANVNYFTSGSAPNRVLVLNFKNVVQSGYGNISSTTNVQIQLFETSDVIEIHNTTNTAPFGFVPFTGNIFIEKTIGIENSTGTIGRSPLTSITQWSVNNTMIRMEYCSAIPAIPTNVTPSVNFCSTATPTTLNATCASGTATWYTYTNPNYVPLSNLNVTPTASTTYSVRCESGGSPNCTSNYVNSTIGVITPPTAPVLTRNPVGDVPSGNLVTLSATGCTYATLLWSDGSTQSTNNSAATKNVYPTTNTSYSAVCKDYNNCSSPISNILNINVLFAPTVTPSTQTICSGGSALLTASGCSTPDIVKWYILGNSTSLGSGTTISVNPSTVGGNYYFATCTRGTVVSNNSPSVLVELRATPTAPTSITKSPTGNVNPNTNVQLTANGCVSGNTIKWENNSTTNPRTVIVTANGTYSAKCVNGTCESATATSTTINLITPPPTISTTSSTSICNGTSVTLTASGCTSPDVVTWSTTTTGTTLTITPASLPVTYTATCTRNGVVSVNSNSITFTSSGSTAPAAATNLTISPTGTVAAGTTITLSATCASGASTYWYRGTGTLVQIGYTSPVTQLPDFTTSYTVKCIGSSYPYCESSAISTTVNVTPQTPVLSVSPDYPSSVCGSNPTYLALSNCRNGTLQWSVNPATSPTPSGNSPYISLGTITQTTTYTATCVETGLSSNSLTVPYIANDLSAITATPTSITSIGQSLNLSATCSGTINWYANGATTSFATGSSVSHTPTTVSTYEARCMNNGCSFSKTITVNFNLTVPTGIGNASAEGTYTEGCYSYSIVIPGSGGVTSSGTACVSTDVGTYFYNKSMSASLCGNYYTFSVCWNGYFIRRKNNIWEIVTANGGTTNGQPITTTYTRLFHTTNAFNSSRPPCSTTWIKDADGSSQTINLTGVCENATAVPCPTALNLDSPPISSDDYSSGGLLKQASANIAATNKITGTTTNIKYTAGKNIQLNAGFKADNGTVFKAEIGGCQ
jgi:hypothetical protein